jgi:beta-glucosidase-like glycosyl hydrolase
MHDELSALISQLTVDEKAAMVAGVDMWHTAAVERLGIPALKMTDGPIGARGERWTGGRSAAFPCGTALGATWDPALVEEVGSRIGNETRRKRAHVLLAPTVNIHRHPLAGRNFECYSEDPYLTARAAVAYITGAQSHGIGCSVKHFTANDSEFERMTISSEVDERTLREISLVPFEAAVLEAGTWSVMVAYNKVNGVYCSEHPWLIDEVLKREWGFDGFVVSDWYATHSTAGAANEIKALVAASSQNTKEGVELVNRAGSSLSEITGSVKRVADIVSEMAAANREQSAGVAEVENTVGQMESVTQKNAQLVEESGAALTSVDQQAEEEAEDGARDRTGDEADAGHDQRRKVDRHAEDGQLREGGGLQDAAEQPDQREADDGRGGDRHPVVSRSACGLVST